MKYKIHVYMLNDDFSEEHAEAQHQGMESENNRFHEWEDEFDINSEIKEVLTRHYENYQLKGIDANDKPFDIAIENMLLFDFIDKDDQITQLAFSESIIESYELNRSEGSLKVYINDYEPHANPITGIYIASKAFPKELIN